MDDDQTSYNKPHRFRVIHSYGHYELWVEDRVAIFDNRDELDRCVELINTQTEPPGQT